MLTYVFVLCQIRTSTTKFFQKLQLMMELKKWVMKGGSSIFVKQLIRSPLDAEKITVTFLKYLSYFQ